MMNEVIEVMTTPSLNHSRWHDKHTTKLTSPRYKFGMTLLLALYLWVVCLTLIFSRSLEDGQRSSVCVGGGCWQLLNTIFIAVNSCILRQEIYNHGRIGVYTDKFHKWWCIFECRHLAQEIEQKHTSSFHLIKPSLRMPAKERLRCKVPRIADVTNPR
jgi:hypothetical protein